MVVVPMLKLAIWLIEMRHRIPGTTIPSGYILVLSKKVSECCGIGNEVLVGMIKRIWSCFFGSGSYAETAYLAY